MIHLNSLGSAWEYCSSIMSQMSMVSAMMTSRCTKMLFIQMNESPNSTDAEKAQKARQVYMSPVTLSILRTARLEMPNLTMGYLGLDAASWNLHRSEVIATLPDVMQTEESEIHYHKGTPIAATLLS